MGALNSHLACQGLRQGGPASRSPTLKTSNWVVSHQSSRGVRAFCWDLWTLFLWRPRFLGAGTRYSRKSLLFIYEPVSSFFPESPQITCLCLLLRYLTLPQLSKFVKVFIFLLASVFKSWLGFRII